MSESMAQLSQSIDESLLRLDSLKQMSESADNEVTINSLCKSLAVLYNNRGFLYYRAIEFNLAADDYTRALRLDPCLAIALYNRATIHYRMNNFLKAFEDLKIAIELDPNNREFQLAFDASCEQLGIQSRPDEPSGGAARLVTAFNAYRDCDPLVLFSGDIMSPSIMSTFTKGEQMIPVLNALAVDCAVFGNHEFDFGVDHLKSWMGRTSFPWLMSNVYDHKTNRPINDAMVWHIIDRNNKRLGIIGLVEEQWLADSLHEGYLYRDFVAEGRKLAKHLKEKASPLKQCVAEIDLILGGHDHDYQIRKINNKVCVKSGTDFRQFSKIDITFIDSEEYEIECQEINVNSYDFKEDPTLKHELTKFGSIRNRETNLGNLISDIALVTTGSEAVLLNSGMFRSDQIHLKGDFRFRDLVRILPMMDELVILNITGYQLWTALECGLSRWPTLDGSFAHVSRIHYEFDPHKPAGSRIDPNSITIGNKCLDLKAKYRLLTEEFLHKGKDGYYVLKECEVLIPKEHCVDVFTLVKKYMESVAQLAADPQSDCKTLVCSSGPKTTAIEMTEYLDFELELRKFEPKVDGRITCLTNVSNI
ncbi:unnamed protein product [Oppiella nova]|uniref:5'-Nucleotidase C-terminal domain-containing protein n=1 Tax=Oppiella nova TaxID=334625 RepID=A0A7R9LP17_9ACAR|nr:unnamed protein product [Oppiella nova]CAG2165476.1 unnamed protein product [Oppiella nova]